MSVPARFVLSATILVAIAIAVGFVLSGHDSFDWALTGILAGLAVGGEALRTWIRHSRGKRRQ